MNEISTFLTAKSAEPGALPPRARRRGGDRGTTILLMVIAFFIATAVGSVVLSSTSVRIPALDFGAPSAAVRGHLVNFPICAGPSRTTCVVDGDTFWLEGVKYRVADIDTPEISSPACPTEAVLGQRATERFAGLLNAGPFELQTYERDEDVYGRKLRIVTRGGESLGLRLVEEGLAHRWDGSKHGWC